MYINICICIHTHMCSPPKKCSAPSLHLREFPRGRDTLSSAATVGVIPVRVDLQALRTVRLAKETWGLLSLVQHLDRCFPGACVVPLPGRSLPGGRVYHNERAFYATLGTYKSQRCDAFVHSHHQISVAAAFRDSIQMNLVRIRMFQPQPHGSNHRVLS